MKLSIWKFPLTVTDQQTIMMPINSRILSVQTQGKTPCIWAIVDTEKHKEVEAREFEIYGTGNPFYEGHRFGKDHRFVGTFQLEGGAFVGHIFEQVEVTGL